MKDAPNQIQHFSDDLDRLIDRYREEYDLSYAAVVGSLHMKIHLLCSEAEEREEEA